MGSELLGLSPARWQLTGRDLPFLWDFIDAAESLGYNSLWCSDHPLHSRLVFDPIAFLSAAAARTRRIRLGTSVIVLSLRNPILTAKELATLDFLSGGRLIVGVGAGNPKLPEFEAFGISPRQRGARVDEAIALMRQLWRKSRVTYRGEFSQVRNISLKPKPLQRPYPPIWIGGGSPAAFRRVGLVGDGWLGSSVTPDEVKTAIKSIRSIARRAGRKVQPDSYGVLLHFNCCKDNCTIEKLKPYLPFGRKDIPLQRFCALGSAAQVGERVQEYLDAGARLVVLRPACPAREAMRQVEMVSSEIAPRLVAGKRS